MKILRHYAIITTPPCYAIEDIHERHIWLLLITLRYTRDDAGMPHTYARLRAIQHITLLLMAMPATL